MPNKIIYIDGRRYYLNYLGDWKGIYSRIKKLKIKKIKFTYKRYGKLFALYVRR